MTTNSAPHFTQKYRFPVSVATVNTSFTFAWENYICGLELSQRLDAGWEMGSDLMYLTRSEAVE